MQNHTIHIFAIFFAIFCLTEKSFSEELNEQKEEFKNEISISNFPIYFFSQPKLTPKLHRYYHKENNNSQSALGLEYDLLFNENKYPTYIGVANSELMKNISIHLAPKKSFKSYDDYVNKATIHFESDYSFELNQNLRFGPSVKVSFGDQAAHMAMGLHFGYGF